MGESSIRHVLLLVGMVGAAGSSACTRAEDSTTSLPGKELYRACVSCHGEDGHGNHAVGAPPIAGLPAWYVEAQVTKFKTGIRGAHPDDHEGLRMRPMARQMANEAEVKSVAGYVESLPPVHVPATLEGADPAAGAVAFAPCTACHGAKGQGSVALKAPPLAGQADWYLLAQLQKFKAGIRGANPKDAQGALMRPMAMTLANEKAMIDLVSHVSTLPREGTP